MTLQFDGTRYNGWQRLGDTDNTIQGKIEALLSKMTLEKIDVIGASRTDKGVHAEAFVCNFFSRTGMSVGEIKNYVNKYLPDDIRVCLVSEEDNRFHCRYNAKSKLYRYTIDNRVYHDVFTRKFSAHVPDRLDISLMQEAANLLVGTLDFAAYTNMKSRKKSTVRTIHDIRIKEENSYLMIDFEGDGFLYNMIRIITGTLIRVGKREIQPEEVLIILNKKDRSLAGPVAEPKGLCLIEVRF